MILNRYKSRRIYRVNQQGEYNEKNKNRGYDISRTSGNCGSSFLYRKKVDKKRTEEKEKNMPSAHYELIDDTVIDNEFFSMQVPEELVEKLLLSLQTQESDS